MELIWRVERIHDDEGPFQGTDLGMHDVYQSYTGKSRRPAPGNCPRLRGFADYVPEARFGCYSLPNLRHWFPKRAIQLLESEHPGEFHVLKLRAPVLRKAGRQVVFDRDAAEVLGAFPLSAVHQDGAL